MNLFSQDYFRYTGKTWRFIPGIKLVIKDHGLRYLMIFRLYQRSKIRFIRHLLKIHQYRLMKRYGIEIPLTTQIGCGLYLGHPYNITINDQAVLGQNINLHKGCTIGQENRGKRKGAPIIGDYVYVGVNATVAGKITIGDHVLIAANTFVNFDVPDHSIVIGNPAKIIESEQATDHYINNTIEPNELWGNQ